MGDANNVAITITGQDQLTPVLRAMQQALTGLAQQLAQQQTFLTAVSQANASNATSTNQLAASYIAMAQAIRDQSQAYAQAQAAALQFRQEQVAAREEARKAAEEARAAGRVWQQMFAVAGGVGIATSIQAAVTQLSHLATEAVQTAAKFELLRISMATVAGNQAEGARAFQFTVDLAQKLGVNMLDLTTVYKNFAAATRGTTLEGEGTKRVFEQIVTAGRAMGATTDQIRHAMLALEQMVSKGCHAAGTLLRMADGTTLPVESIPIGALLMGPNHQSRTVLALAHGTEMMWRVHPARGEAFVVNEHHLLRVHDGSVDVEATLLLATYLASDATTRAQMTLLHETWGHVPFRVTEAGEGEYYGFLLSGDHCYLDAQGFQHHNTVSMEELRRQMGNALPGVFNIAARAMGVTTEELNKLIKTGTVEAIPFVIKLGNQFEREFGKAREAAESADAAFGRFSNNMTQVSKTVGDNILVILKPIVDIINKAFDLDAELRRRSEQATAGEAQLGRLPILPEEGVKIPESMRTRLAEIRELQTGLLFGFPVEEKARHEERLRELLAQQEADAKRLRDQLHQLRLRQYPGEVEDVADEQQRVDIEKLRTLARTIRKQLDQDLAQEAAISALLPATLDAQLESAKSRLELFTTAMATLAKKLPLDPRTQEVRPGAAELIQPFSDMVTAEQDQIRRLTETRENAATHAKRLEKDEADALHARETVFKLHVDAIAKEAKREEEERTRSSKALQKAWMDDVEAGITLIDKQTEAHTRWMAATERLLEQMQTRPGRRRVVGLEGREPEGGTPDERAARAARTMELEAMLADREAQVRMQQMFTTIGQTLEGTFTSLWDQIFTIGENRAESFGVTITRIFRDLFKTLSTQMLNEILRVLVKPEGGESTFGTIARIGLRAIGAFVGATGGVGGGGAGGWGGSGGVGTSAAVTSGSFQHGGLITRPTFGLMGEGGRWEAVVPLEHGAIPVTVSQSAPADGRGGQRPLVVEIHNNYEGAYDPRMNRTSKAEVLRWTIENIEQDGPLRRIIQQRMR